MNELKNNDSIVIVQANQGGSVAGIEKAEYISISKIKEKINDHKMYEGVNDPIKVIKRKIKELTERLRKAKRVTQR